VHDKYVQKSLRPFFSEFSIFCTKSSSNFGNDELSIRLAQDPSDDIHYRKATQVVSVLLCVDNYD
jgi:hypothetical protein